MQKGFSLLIRDHAHRLFFSEYWVYACLRALLFSWFFALCAQITLWLPFNLVPMALHPAPLFIATILFGKLAITAYLLYLVQGALGLPFFAGGLCGITRIIGPTGGYLLGFLASMIILQVLSSKFRESSYKLFILLLFVEAIVFVPGLLQLSWFVESTHLFAVGLYPFIIGDFLIKPLMTIFVVKIWDQWYEK